MNDNRGPYFSHDANSTSDQKIIKLLSVWKWKGYGLYWAIIELLRLNSNYELEKNYKILAKSLKSSEKVVKSVIEDFNLFRISDTHFWSESLKRRMKNMKDKSELGRKAAKVRWLEEQKRKGNKAGLQQLSDILNGYN